MESINNKIRRAVKGDIDAIEFVHQHYLYIGDKFYENNGDKITKEELYTVIEKAINEFFNIEMNIPLILHIYKSINDELKNKKETNIEVKKNVLLACQGDINARNTLIQHYSAIVVEKAKNYDYMEYEDLVQFGMIKLIEYIDTLIVEHQNSEFFTNGIGRSIDIYFGKTLKKAVTLWKRPLSYLENELDNFRMEHEFKEVVDYYTENAVKREIIKKYFLEKNTLQELGNEYNMSHENVRKIIKAAQPQLRKNYLK